MSAAHGRAAALGVLADRALGEPPAALHPVAWFGSALGALERRWWADARRRGALHLAAGAGLGLATGSVLARIVGRAAATAVATAVASGGRMLGDVALDVGAALEEGDLERARAQLPTLVGRDPTGLDEHEIARAVIESVAENGVDAVIAPLVWGTLAGAPGVLAQRAINTLDAMVGNRSPRYARFGWASARADDVAAWVPARVAVALVALARPHRSMAIAAAVRRDAPAHPSPNGGVIEAAFAAALDIRLGGVNRYGDRVERRGILHPNGRSPVAADIDRAVRLLRTVTLLGAAVASSTRSRTRSATDRVLARWDRGSRSR